jgi:hypothetical protein
MILTVLPKGKAEPILAGLRPLFERHSGFVYVAGVAVGRQVYNSARSTPSPNVAFTTGATRANI